MDLAELIQEEVREIDIFARWGGEEFIILTPRTDNERAYQTAERLRECIENHDFLPEENITCSFGTAEYRQEEGKDSFMERVDRALYEAKRSGRNQTVSDQEV